MQEMVQQKKAQYPDGQIIVYCRTVQQTKDFAVRLECPAFYNTVGTDVEKDAILEKLRRGQERVFTSTNALGEGIDAPGVRVIIHIGMVNSLDDYGQQSGRAGRDGRSASEAIILRKTWIDPNGKKRREQGWEVEAEMKAFMEGDRCRRAVLDAYMDGRGDSAYSEQEGRTTCEAGEQRCDVCRGRGLKRVRVVLAEDIEREQSAKRRRVREDIVEGEEIGGEDIGREEIEEEVIQERIIQEEVIEGGIVDEMIGEEITAEEEQVMIEAEIRVIQKAAERRQAQQQAEEQQQERERQKERQAFQHQRQQFAAIESRQRAHRIQQGQMLERVEADFEA